MKRQVKYWKKISGIHMYDKELYPEFIRTSENQ